MLCTPVFIFTSVSLAVLGHSPTLWFTDLTVATYVIFNTLFWVYVNFVHKKMDKTQKYLKCTVFVWYDNGRERWLGTQSITTERVSLRIVSIEWLVRILICYHFSLGSGFLVINLVLWVVTVFLCFPPSIFGWEHLKDLVLNSFKMCWRKYLNCVRRIDGTISSVL